MVNRKGENTLHEVLAIQNLNDDCLLHIFSFLSIIDRVKIQRVCQRWKTLSHISWESVKRFSVRKDFWGISDKNNIEIDRCIFKRILELCGRYVTHVDLSNENEYYGSNNKIRIQSCKNIFCILQEMCPNIRSINVGRPCTESTVEYVANHFNKLTHFAIQGVNDKYEDYLSLLFSNNQNLKYLSMTNCFLINKCLLNLKPEAIEELCLDDCSVDMLQNLLSFLKQFKKLSSLKFVRCRSEQTPWITSIIRTISSSSTNLKKLDIYFYDCDFESINYNCIDQLKNLEILYIGGNIMATDKMISEISNNCRRLTNVRIYNSDNITDAGFWNIASLPNLQYLSISSLEMITDDFFEIMIKLITLECRRCPNIKNDGIAKLILASNHLKMIKINCCAQISVLGFCDSVIASQNDKLTVEIDSSEIDDNFVSNYCLITKYRESIVKKTKQLCYNCFKASNADASCTYCCDIEEAL